MEVVNATRAHAEDLLSRPLRQHDIDEWVMGSGLRVRDALLGLWDEDCEALTRRRALLNEDGGCICIWGSHVHPEVPGTGGVFLLASKEAQAKGKAIHRLWREEIAGMHEFSGPNLRALAWEQNILHLHWLEVVGFEPIAVMRQGGGTFILHERHREDSQCAVH